MNVKDLKNLNSELQSWNDQFSGDLKEQEFIVDSRAFHSMSIELDRIERAEGTRTALGIFGESQCGKSYLTSALIGGMDTQLMIDGLNEPKFHDYNQNEAGKESTSLVTRMTSYDESYDVPSKSVMVRYLSPSDIMWSFVYGFYNELDWLKGFNLDEEQVSAIEKRINSDDNSSRMMDNVELLRNEFSECLTWIVENRIYEGPLADSASDYFSSHDKISIEKYVDLVSTLWKCDETLTKAFRARIETLSGLDFSHSGSIPEKLLKKLLDATSLDKLSKEVGQNNLFSSKNGDITENEYDELKIANLQAVIKEVCLLTKADDKESLISKVDLLDFPGSRAWTGVQKSNDSIRLKEDSEKDDLSLISHVFKRGKLRYLFELYKKEFDISLLLFCTETDKPQLTEPSKEMLEGWVKMYQNNEDELDRPSLFVAFTKIDKLLRSAQNTDSDSANERITARFKENFQDSFGSWTKNYKGKDRAFNNIYLVRNPRADNNCFERDDADNEKWRAGWEDGKNTTRKHWMNNEMVEKFLGEKKDVLFDKVFEPGSYGLKYLQEQINNKFDSEPDKKEKYLRSRIDEVEERLRAYLKKYSPNTNKQAAKDEQKKLAMEFISGVRSNYESLGLILNAIHDNCPDPTYLDSLLNKATKMNVGSGPVQLGSPLASIIPKFVDNWFGKLDRNNNLSDESGIRMQELKLFFKTIKKYILRKDNTPEIIDPFSGFDLIGNPAHTRALRNYLIWHVGEKVYYLEYVEQNGTPKGPINIPNDLDPRTFVLNEIWNKQLPEIYAGNFEMKLPKNGIQELVDIGKRY